MILSRMVIPGWLFIILPHISLPHISLPGRLPHSSTRQPHAFSLFS